MKSGILWKIFSLKQTNQILPATTEKNQSLYSPENHLIILQTIIASSFLCINIEIRNHIQVNMGLQWGKETKAIQTDLGIFMHISAYSGMFQNYSGIFRTQSFIYNEAFAKIVNSYSFFRK